MDSPNLNWSVLGLIGEKRSKQEFSDMINIRSCGLHNVHGAFKSGMKASEWNLAKFLKGTWQLLHDSRARRVRTSRFAEVKIFHCGMFAYGGMISFPWLSVAISVLILGFYIWFGTL